MSRQTAIESAPGGNVALTTESATLLGRLAMRRGVSHVIRVALEPIVDFEKVLGCVIPFEIIALVLVEGRTLSDLRSFTSGISKYYAIESREAGRSLERELGWNHIAFAMLAGTPEDWTDEPRFAAFPRGSDRNAPWVEWVVRKPVAGAHPYSLERYLNDKWRLGNETGPPLELVLTPQPQPPEEYANHPRYGRGRVISRAEGKATVEFEDGTTRKLAETFLSFAKGG